MVWCGILGILVIPFDTYSSRAAGQSLDQKGRQFLLSFIDSARLIPGGEIYLVVNADEKSTVVVTMPSLNQTLQRTLEARQTWKFNVSIALRCSVYFTPVKLAVTVTSTGRITLYVEDGTMGTASGYLALPYHGLSTSYLAVTYGGSYEASSIYPVFLILATEDNTSVVIEFVVAGGGNCSDYVTGSRGVHTLNAYDVYGVRCTEDFTGSRIESDKPVVVISGHQGALISGLYRDVMQEMLLPIDHFGTSHVLIGHDGRGLGSVNRVVAASDLTTVTSNLGETYHMNRSMYVDIDTDAVGDQCIMSTQPVLVVSFAKNRPAFLPTRFNAFMSLVPATTQFTRFKETDFGLASAMGISETAYLAIVFNSSEVQLQSLPSSIHVTMPGCDFQAVTVPVTSWPLHVEDGGVSLGLSMYTSYGPQQHAGVGFPLNIKLDNEDAVIAPSTEPVPPTDVTIHGTTPSLLDSCDCLCRDDVSRNVTPELLQEWTRELKERLLVETRNLSKTVRRLTSAVDSRPSAVGIGTLGICIFSLIGALIILPDIGTCFIHFLHSWSSPGNVVANQSK